MQKRSLVNGKCLLKKSVLVVKILCCIQIVHPEYGVCKGARENYANRESKFLEKLKNKTK